MKGKCFNIDYEGQNCPEYDKLVEIPDGEDFVCLKCGYKLQEANEGGENFLSKFKLPLIIAAAVLVIAGMVWFLAGSRNAPEDAVTPMEEIIVE